MAYRKSLAFGRRTRTDILKGKNIRKDADGCDVFEDYWTDTEDDDISDSSKSSGTHTATRSKSLASNRKLDLSDDENERSERRQRKVVNSAESFSGSVCDVEDEIFKNENNFTKKTSNKPNNNFKSPQKIEQVLERSLRSGNVYSPNKTNLKSPKKKITESEENDGNSSLNKETTRKENFRLVKNIPNKQTQLQRSEILESSPISNLNNEAISEILAAVDVNSRFSRTVNATRNYTRSPDIASSLVEASSISKDLEEAELSSPKGTIVPRNLNKDIDALYGTPTNSDIRPKFIRSATRIQASNRTDIEDANFQNENNLTEKIPEKTEQAIHRSSRSMNVFSPIKKSSKSTKKQKSDYVENDENLNLVKKISDKQNQLQKSEIAKFSFVCDPNNGADSEIMTVVDVHSRISRTSNRARKLVKSPDMTSRLEVEPSPISKGIEQAEFASPESSIASRNLTKHIEALHNSPTNSDIRPKLVRSSRIQASKSNGPVQAIENNNVKTGSTKEMNKILSDYDELDQVIMSMIIKNKSGKVDQHSPENSNSSYLKGQNETFSIKSPQKRSIIDEEINSENDEDYPKIPILKKQKRLKKFLTDIPEIVLNSQKGKQKNIGKIREHSNHYTQHSDLVDVSSDLEPLHQRDRSPEITSEKNDADYLKSPSLKKQNRLKNFVADISGIDGNSKKDIQKSIEKIQEHSSHNAEHLNLDVSTDLKSHQRDRPPEIHSKNDAGDPKSPSLRKQKRLKNFASSKPEIVANSKKDKHRSIEKIHKPSSSKNLNLLDVSADLELSHRRDKSPEIYSKNDADDPKSPSLRKQKRLKNSVSSIPKIVANSKKDKHRSIEKIHKPSRSKNLNLVDVSADLELSHRRDESPEIDFKNDADDPKSPSLRKQKRLKNTVSSIPEIVGNSKKDKHRSIEKIHKASISKNLNLVDVSADLELSHRRDRSPEVNSENDAVDPESPSIKKQKGLTEFVNSKKDKQRIRKPPSHFTQHSDLADASPDLDISLKRKSKKKVLSKDSTVSTKENIRRSTRQKYPPLAHWRNERLCYRFESGQIRILGVDEGTNEDKAAINNILMRRVKPHRVKHPKVKHRRNVIYDSVIDKNVKLDLVVPYSSVSWDLPISSPVKPSFRIKRTLQTRTSAFGFIEIKGFEQKPAQYMPEEDLQMTVLKGHVEVIIQDNVFETFEKDMFVVPRGAAYSVKNLGKRAALLSFAVGKFKFLESTLM